MNPLTGRESWSLWRLCDGRLEANGFHDQTEAQEWAAAYGWEIVARPDYPWGVPTPDHDPR